MPNRSYLFPALSLGGACAAALLWGLPSRAVAADPPAATAAPAPTDTAPAAQGKVDPAAMDLLKKVSTTMLGLKTYQARCDTVISHNPSGGKPGREKRESATLVAAKPNFMRYEQHDWKQDPKTGNWQPSTEPGITFVCDGKTNWRQYGSMYRTDNRTTPPFLSTVLEPWDGFYSEEGSPAGWIAYQQKMGGLIELRRDPSTQVAGIPCDVVFAHYKSSYNGNGMEYWTTWYIGGDGLVRRKVEKIDFENRPGYTREAVLKDIRVNEPVDTHSKLFAYSPPKGVKREEEIQREQPPLLAKGSAAPDFTALDRDGKPVKLSDYRGKVVVVDFWASWCGPCVASMPHNQEVAKKFRSEGLPVVLLAVDNSEERDAFSGWVAKKSGELDALTFVHADPKASHIASKLYHVTGIPTQYVIDPTGVIRASFLGYGGPTDDLEKAVRAALASKS